MIDGIEKAIEAAGSSAKLARLLHVTRGAVAKWRREKFIPAKRLIEMERTTGVPREKLRPDLYR